MTPLQKQIREEFENTFHQTIYCNKHEIYPCKECGSATDWFISKLQSQNEELVRKIENTPIEKAHTYSSENADIYRAYDRGQENYKNIVLTIIQSQNYE